MIMNLTTEQIIEGNIKLAEFEGKLTKCLQCGGVGVVIGFRTATTCCNRPLNTGECCNSPIPEQMPEPEQCMMCEATGYYSELGIRDFTYHKDWNELMRVFEKINELQYPLKLESYGWYWDERNTIKQLMYETELEACFQRTVTLVTKINKINQK